MHWITNCNRRKLLRLYHERFPYKTMPDHKFFSCLHCQLYKSSSFHFKRLDEGCCRHVHNPEMEEHILREYEDNPNTRSIPQGTSISKRTFWKIFAWRKTVCTPLRVNVRNKGSWLSSVHRFLLLVFTAKYIHSELLCKCTFYRRGHL